ncbi:MAG: hypothetical protein ACPGTU_03545 [Myxococcota bacterium]
MADIIEFPTSSKDESTSPSERVKIIDKITTMAPHELEQAAELVATDLSVCWVNRHAVQGITHTIGPTVYRRLRKNSRILQADAVGVISEGWLESAFEALECLREQWGGRITLVWTLVTKRTNPPSSVGNAWTQLVAEGSPLERILIVDPHQVLGDGPPQYGIPEPIVVVHPNDLDAMVDLIAAEHTSS